MKNLKKLGAAVVLTAALSLSVFAGETPTPPCASPVSGEIQTPPYAAAPSGMGIPTSTTSELSLTEIAADLLLNILPLF